MIRFVARLLLGLLPGMYALSATAQIIKLDSQPAIRQVGQNNWQFRAGDSTGWSSPAYDSRHWATLTPRVNLSDNPTLWKVGHGWFRKKVQFRQLNSRSVTMSIQQFGASVVYLDGKLVATLRPFAFDSGGSQRIIAFIPVSITDTSQHTLAIRYAFRRDPLLGLSVNKAPFQLEFQLSNQSAVDLLDSQSTSAGIQYLLVGIFGVLSLLHSLFYRANPTQRVNLTLALTMLAFALIFLIDLIDTKTGTLTLSSLMTTLSWATANLALGLLLLSVYIYLGRRLGWVFWPILFVLAALAGYNSFISPVTEGKAGIPFLLVLTEYIRVSWLAKRRNPDPAARLPWNSLKFALYSTLAVIVLAAGAGILTSVTDAKTSLDWVAIPIVLLALSALFSIPIGLSFSLVGDYARTYQSLRQQLTEVNRLSAQTLAQEQEKQALLANQNERLEQQVADRTAELNQSLTELRETQTQLIQREKLASLGELTAGIAHEIQNPLNFVNNFSEVSAELVAELTEETDKPDRDAELEAELLADLGQNLQKITHHGKRASSIVKGMLEHSRSIAGERQPTDLNALANEYLNLAYHAMRSKEPTFNARLTTDFGDDPGLVPVVAQEIGRVFLNLFSNAFYALYKRQQVAEPGYEPTLLISTKRLADAIVLRVRDNGTGIPLSVQQKVFQPFFTTKPSGEGTGLGLSLSYDIITKGYGGTVSLNTEEGQFTEFSITLPIA